MRSRSLLAADNNRLRRRVRSRSSTICSLGTKLPRTSPTRRRSAKRRLSSGSVFSPRRAFTCSGLATITATRSWRTFHTGTQYVPVLSMTTVEHAWASSHSRPRFNSCTVVPKVCVCCTGSTSTEPVRMVTVISRLPMSIPAQHSKNFLMPAPVLQSAGASATLMNFASRALGHHPQVLSALAGPVCQAGSDHHIERRPSRVSAHQSLHVYTRLWRLFSWPQVSIGHAGLTTKRGEIEAKSFVIKDPTRKSFRFKDRPGNLLLTP